VLLLGLGLPNLAGCDPRRVEYLLKPSHLDRACLLCAKPTAEQCHRRLVAEYLQKKWAGSVQVEIIHLPQATR
jgi:uncharacterized protein (DUF488 family)